MKHMLLAVTCSAFIVTIAPATNVDFGPQGSLSRTLLPLITRAKKRCFIASYLLTSSSLVTALLRAHHRGVRVQIVTDASMIKTHRGKEVLRQLRAAPLPVFIFSHTRHRFLMHHKFAVIDDKLFTGSMNWTRKGSTRNHEKCYHYDYASHR